MSLLQFMLTGSPGYSKAVPQKKVMSVFPPLPPELSISWEEQDSLVFQDVSVRDLCERKWISFMCSVNICIKGNLYHHRGGRAVMCLNAATKAITHDKFSTDRGSHRCCETFRLTLGTCQPYLSSVLTRSMPHRQCVYTSWYQKRQTLQQTFHRNCFLQSDHCIGILWRSETWKIKINRHKEINNWQFISPQLFNSGFLLTFLFVFLLP